MFRLLLARLFRRALLPAGTDREEGHHQNREQPQHRFENSVRHKSTSFVCASTPFRLRCAAPERMSIPLLLEMQGTSAILCLLSFPVRWDSMVAYGSGFIGRSSGGSLHGAKKLSCLAKPAGRNQSYRQSHRSRVGLWVSLAVGSLS